MGLSYEMTKAFLETQGMKYDEIGNDKEDAFVVGIGGLNNKENLRIVVFFDDDSTVSIGSFGICKVPENKEEDIYKVCSQLNRQFRWVKFFMDSDDKSITVQDDAVIQPESSGEEIFELILRMSRIVDDAYPILMKTLWS